MPDAAMAPTSNVRQEISSSGKTMSSLADTVKAKCTEAFHPLYIDVVDFTDGACSGAKIGLTIVSEDFDKVPLIQRHRKVQALLKEDGLMDEKIHALTIKAWTPEQWEAKK